MYPLYFAAALKTENGKLLEIGEACLTGEDPLDFNGEFVPLMNLGEPAQIVRLEKGQETEAFPGQVWRCTKKSLRLTKIPPLRMERAKRLFTVNVNLPVYFAPIPEGTEKINWEKSLHLKANLRYLSTELLRLTILGPSLEPGQAAILRCEKPLLEDFLFQAGELVPLGANASLILGKPLSLSREDRRTIENYLEKQSLQPFTGRF